MCSVDQLVETRTDDVQQELFVLRLLYCTPL